MYKLHFHIPTSSDCAPTDLPCIVVCRSFYLYRLYKDARVLLGPE